MHASLSQSTLLSDPLQLLNKSDILLLAWVGETNKLLGCANLQATSQLLGSYREHFRHAFSDHEWYAATQNLLAGNPWTDPEIDNKGAVDFWWSHAIISDEVRHALLRFCDFSGVGPLLRERMQLAVQAVQQPTDDGVSAALLLECLLHRAPALRNHSLKPSMLCSKCWDRLAVFCSN